jgi:type I restriction enzyme R subunit
MRTKNILDGFSDFKWADLDLTEQTYEDYKSKYLDEYQRIKDNTGDGEKTSILDDVDFELELIHKDEINVSYILALLAKYLEANEEEQPKQREHILKLLDTTPNLRSKRELIEAFIMHEMDGIDPNEVEEEFEKFVAVEREKSFKKLVEDENLLEIELGDLIDTYLYDGRTPLKDDVAKTMRNKPKLLERKTVVPKLLGQITGFVEKFYHF